MAAKNLEMNSFTVSTMEPNDDDAYSTDYPIFQGGETACDQTLKDSSNNATTYPSILQNHQNFRNCLNNFEAGLTINTLSELYAQLITITAGISLLVELLPGPVQLFESHVYVFIIVLSLGLICLLYGIFKNLHIKYAFLKADSRGPHQCTCCKMSSDSKISIKFCLKSAILILGFGVVFSSCLGSIAVISAAKKCGSALSSTLPVLQCLFVLFQMIFVITNSKDTYNVFGCCHKLITMHLIATTSALCIRLFLWESALDWQDVLHFKHDSSKKWELNELNISIHALETNLEQNLPNHIVHVTSNCWWRIPEFNVSEDITAIHVCLQNSTVGFVWQKTSQYLYPLMIQYYISFLCFLYLISRHCMHNCVKDLDQSARFVCGGHSDGIWNRSTKGLFLGFLIFISVLIYLIIYITVDDLKFSIILGSEYCFIYGLAILSGILCLYQIKRINLSNHLDHDLQRKIIQKMGIIAIFLYGVCNIIVGCFSKEKLSFLPVLEGVFMIAQVIIQYILIIQLKNKKVDQTNINEKPGRQSVAFLLLCNVSLWMLDCFISWNNISNHHLASILGKIAWSIAARFLFPLIAFYRLYSAMVLYDAWKICYF